jgi:hypothetical protein
LAQALPPAPLKPAGPLDLYLPKLDKRTGTAGLAATVSHLRAFYNAISSVELRAKLWISLPQQSGAGLFVYAATGDQYRLLAIADRSLHLSSNVEMAYDLKRHQSLNVDTSTLSLYQEAPRQLPAPFPNPLFLPAAFLGLEDDRCDGCRLSLKDVTDPERWQSRSGVSFASKGEDSGTVLIFPGTSLQGEPYFYRVFAGPGSGAIDRIELVRPNGHVFERMVFSDYRAVEGGAPMFPHEIVLTGLSEDGASLGILHYTIQSVRINSAVGPQQFTLPAEKARIVIDEDRHSFLKHPSLGGGVPPEKN